MTEIDQIQPDFGGPPPSRCGGSRGTPTPAPLNEFDSHTNTRPDHIGLSTVGARSVSWWSVHEFVQKYLETAGHYPMAGTPAWCELADGDRRKWAALLDFAQHHALRVDTCQAARCDAGREISTAEDWSAVAHHVRNQADFYAERPWLKRGAA